MEKKLDIKINQSIISILGRKLYQSSFGDVVLRELLQNSLDANSTIIRVDYNEHILIVSDNGNGIQKIEGLLDTIGESIKDSSNLESIGGYGLAKLAIFGCKTFEFKSISGSFSTGFLYNPDNKILSGTTVICEFGDEDVSYNYEYRIETYLKSIKRNCQFFYNGDLIESPNYNQCLFGNNKELIADTRDNGHAIIRVNGLPSFQKWIRNLSNTVFFDYTVVCSPYDKNYPLTSNRDGFISGTEEDNNLQSRINKIEEKLESDKKEAENIAKKESSLIFRNKSYLAMGDVSLQNFKESALLISTWERYIKQIADITNYDITTCSFGLSDGTQENALFAPDINGFAIDYHISGNEKGKILSLALHEFIHFMEYGRCGHDQSFASYLTEITGKVIKAIYDGNFRK